jgi:hypothetical protein
MGGGGGRGLLQIKESILTHNHDFSQKNQRMDQRKNSESCEFHVNFWGRNLVLVL